jgi:spermidine/putrescine transport system ATP-binding protein
LLLFSTRPENVAGVVRRVDGACAELATAAGLVVRAGARGALAVGDRAAAYVRPEVFELARDAQSLPPSAQRLAGHVESLLFDGANSAVLVREATTAAELRIALPQTGRLADLRAGDAVAFGFDADRAVAFRVDERG